MNPELISKYIMASELFNEQPINYQIRVFIDFDFLNIIIDDIKNKVSYPFKILLSCVKDLSVDDILKCYNELVENIK